MNPWTLIIAAYALTVAGTLALTWWSYVAMRRAEKTVDELGQRP